MDKQEVAQVIASEGIGYAVTKYMSADSIADPKLKKMWANAATALNAIEDYLSDELEEAGF